MALGLTVQAVSTCNFHPKAERYPRLHDRHPEEASTRRRGSIYDRLMINVALDDNRVILMFYIHRSGSIVLVKMIFFLLMAFTTAFE